MRNVRFAWLREKLERRKPLDTPDGRIVNIDVKPDGTIHRSLRDRRTRSLNLTPGRHPFEWHDRWP